MGDTPSGTTIQTAFHHLSYTETNNSLRPHCFLLRRTRCWGGTLAWSPDGKRIASTDDRTILVWDAFTGKNVVSLQDQKSFTIMPIAWSPDGKSIAAGGAYPNGDVQIWDAATGKVIQKPQARIDTIWSITWSPDSRYLAAGGYLHVVDVWNAKTGQRLYTDTNYTGGSHAGRGHGIDWSPDGKRLASASQDTTLQLWDPFTGANRTTYHFSNFVNDLAWSPDGRKIALTILKEANNTLQGSIDILNAASGQTLHTQTFSPSRIGPFSWSPDGKYIANASSTDDGKDQTVHVWDVTTGKVLYKYTGISTSYVEFAVAWSSVGNHIAFADGNKIRIWEVL